MIIKKWAGVAKQVSVALQFKWLSYRHLLYGRQVTASCTHRGRLCVSAYLVHCQDIQYKNIWQYQRTNKTHLTRSYSYD